MGSLWVERTPLHPKEFRRQSRHAQLVVSDVARKGELRKVTNAGVQIRALGVVADILRALGTPLGRVDDAGLDKLEPLEHTNNLRAGARVDRILAVPEHL